MNNLDYSKDFCICVQKGNQIRSIQLHFGLLFFPCGSKAPSSGGSASMDTPTSAFTVAPK